MRAVPTPDPRNSPRQAQDTMSNFSSSQIVTKPAVSSAGGIVAAQHRRAAEAGAAVLAAGGDAVDAAVATSFALGVLEPWMSGPGGGGAMLIHRARDARTLAVDFGPLAPAALDPADYPLAGSGVSSDLFPWPAVVDERNATGASAIAVPGVVDGMRTAHEAFGIKPWRELVMPAAELAEEGLLVDWYAALIIASATQALAANDCAAATFLEAGRWPTVSSWTALNQKRVDLAQMGRSLRRLAERGPREFYEGELARGIARDIAAAGDLSRQATSHAIAHASASPSPFPIAAAPSMPPPGSPPGLHSRMRFASSQHGRSAARGRTVRPTSPMQKHSTRPIAGVSSTWATSRADARDRAAPAISASSTATATSVR